MTTPSKDCIVFCTEDGSFVWHLKREIASVSLLLGFITLGFLLLLLLGKTLSAWELRALNHEYRANQNQIAELEEDLDTSRRKYLIALKAEGVAKHKASQGKARLASLKQHLEQLEKTAVQQEAQKQKSLEQNLEGLVMKALGGTSVRRDSQFKRVMKVIHQLIDLEKESNNEDLIAAIQEKIDGLGRKGLIEAADRGKAVTAGGASDQASEDEAADQETVASGQAGEKAATDTATRNEAADSGESEPAEPSKVEGQKRLGRRDLVRDAVLRRKS